MMHQAEKWREMLDPFALDYHSFELKKVLGYPHAGNDVFYVEGVHAGKKVRAYVKAARQPGADLARETAILQALQGFPVPKVLDAGENFCVTAEVEGERLSTIVGGNETMQSLAYMSEYGEMLARIHGVRGDFQPVAHRRFFDVPERAHFEKNDLLPVYDYLCAHAITEADTCFCHGDFHYANVLWRGGHISGVLDWELCGMGARDFDIAWAIIRRPGQRFLTSPSEMDAFLSGYARQGTCCEARVRYNMALIYTRFYAIGRDDVEYTAYVRRWLRENTR